MSYRFRPVFAAALLIACGGPPPAAPPPAPPPAAPPAPPPPTRLEQYQAIVVRLLEEYAALGINIDGKKFEVVLGDTQRVTSDFERMFSAFRAPGQFDAMAALLHLKGKSGVTPDAVRAAAVVGSAQGLQAYYDYAQRVLVFRDTELAQMIGLEPIIAHELGHAYQDQVQETLTEYMQRDFPSLDARKAAHTVMEGQAELLSLSVTLMKQRIPLERLDPDISDPTLGRLSGGEALSVIYQAGRRFALYRYRA
ncbi:MAG TPA: hypothetical protein VMF89_17705, partial [Polyangiales bacterium]|nr:hypothetical protein [Polyangiales bacterium]